MTDRSRREFFKAIIPKEKPIKKISDDEDILTFGHLLNFPVHSMTKIKLQEKDFVVESLPEGVRLRQEQTHRIFKLSLSNSGLLRAHLNEEWPASGILSLFTGEIYII